MTVAVTPMSPMHEQVHSDAGGQQSEQNAISGKEVDAMFVRQKESASREESEQSDPGARFQ
tara:strand:- start:1269 stop:1451 length:183 start_codon:yes stop_codon:yes gene_type:complete